MDKCTKMPKLSLRSQHQQLRTCRSLEGLSLFSITSCPIALRLKVGKIYPDLSSGNDATSSMENLQMISYCKKEKQVEMVLIGDFEVCCAGTVANIGVPDQYRQNGGGS